MNPGRESEEIGCSGGDHDCLKEFLPWKFEAVLSDLDVPSKGPSPWDIIFGWFGGQVRGLGGVNLHIPRVFFK